MKKPELTETQFQTAIKNLSVSQQTLDIAYGVLVEGISQTHFVEQLNLTKGAVWQSVERVRNAHKEQVPEGYERITVLLPEHQAFIVKRWEQIARKNLEDANEDTGDC